MQLEIIAKLESNIEEIGQLPKSDCTLGAATRLRSGIECLQQDIEFQAAKAEGKTDREALKEAVEKTTKKPKTAATK